MKKADSGKVWCFWMAGGEGRGGEGRGDWATDCIMHEVTSAETTDQRSSDFGVEFSERSGALSAPINATQRNTGMTRRNVE